MSRLTVSFAGRGGASFLPVPSCEVPECEATAAHSGETRYSPSSRSWWPQRRTPQDGGVGYGGWCSGALRAGGDDGGRRTPPAASSREAAVGLLALAGRCAGGGDKWCVGRRPAGPARSAVAVADACSRKN